MKKMILIVLCSLFSISAFAVGATSNVEANKKLVRDFYEMAFNQHKPTEAAKKYIGSKYIQHNPYVPNGAEAFYSYFEKHFKENPKSHVEIKRVMGDGDLVALHLLSKQNDTDRGRAIVDIFRVENGKIVEHWDVIQDVPEKTANGNTMF
ncbi:nuclear transport factor 2 family protein [Bdellovibrio sp. BCCA]|uniref:nuclear transport factor 2 family protein n=1 Tax=Bdellovibrio sp. BCCA TaxID=3136281 RepID=UPI0030F1064B